MLLWAEILACWTGKRSNRVHTGEVGIIGERCGVVIPGWVEWEGLSKVYCSATVASDHHAQLSLWIHSFDVH